MKRKMAWVDKAEHLEWRESKLPELKEDEVLIETKYSAICGSDVHLYHNLHPFVKAPCTIGHELSGVVVAVGKGVKKVAIGDLVAPEPILICGECEYCLSGKYHMCTDVSYAYRRGQAGFGDYFICKERWAHKLPEGMDSKEGAVVEPLSVAIHGVEKAGELLGKSVAVIGAGAIGAFAAALCRIKGASKVIIVDINEYRLKVAARGVAYAVVNAASENVEQRILELTEGKGCDVVIECTGSEVCVKNAINIVCKMGTIVQLGISSRPFNDFNYAALLQKEITLKGSQGYCFDFEKAIRLIQSKMIDLNRYITKVYSEEEINEAFKMAASPSAKCMKVLISYGRDELR